MTTMTRALAALLLFALPACGDDGNKVTPDAGPDIDAPVADTPAVVLVERVFGAGGARSYVISVLPAVPTAAVDRSVALSLTSADPELFNGKLYVRNRDLNKMTRYAIDADRKLVEEKSFLFTPTGLGGSRYNSMYVSAELAYLLDSTDYRLIGWNPTTMELTGSIIPLDAARKDASLTGSFSAPVKVGNRLISAINWEDFTKAIMYPGSGALVVEIADPTHPKIIETSRVGGGFRITADGDDAYLTGTVGADVRTYGGGAFGGGALPTSGIVKLPAGQDAFDPSYLVDVDAATGNKSVWAIHRIDSGKLLAQVYDPAMALPANVADYGNSTNFIFGTMDTATQMFTPIAAPPRGGRSNAGNHVVDGKLYIQTSGATGSTAYALSATGAAEAFPVPAGDVWFLARAR